MDRSHTIPTRNDAYERFTALLVANQPALMGFIRTLLPQAGEAEDVLQKTCLIAWQKFDQFDESTAFSAWACKIAYFEVKNFLRTNSRDKHVFSSEVLDQLAQDVPEDSERLAAERVALRTCVEALVPADRELLAQAYDPATTVQQIAEHLGKTANSLYKQLNRIRRRLYSCITIRLKQGGGA